MNYILTVAIPCYNSAAYMNHAVDSVLEASRADIQILIVDDGSTDETREIGLRYAAAHPDQIRVLSKENGGHGDAVMYGLSHAEGAYFKVLDSDDWLDSSCLAQIAACLSRLEEEKSPVDLFLANYVYEKTDEHRKKVIHYRKTLPLDRCFSWEEAGHFRVYQNILMHSVIYRTQLLRDCGLTLPKHTFYVDNLYVYQPLPAVHTLYYMDLDLYHYYIGRPDQSVQESIMIRRIDQQLLVTRQMFAAHQLDEVEPQELRTYMAQYLTVMLSICTIFLLKANTPESEQKLEQLWNDIRANSPAQYACLDTKLFYRLLEKHRPRLLLPGYKIAQKLFHFN